MTNDPNTYCAYHPNIVTALRCKKCDNYICPKCAVRTPTGYQCKTCTRTQQKAFETAEWLDYLIGFITAGVLSLVASFVVGLVGSVPFLGWILVSSVAPTTGVIISNVVHRAIQKRRSKTLYFTIAAAVVMGAVPMALFSLFTMDLWGVFFQILYLILVVPTVYYRISGIQLFK